MCDLKQMKSISDEDLFKDPPPREDCPICLLPMPYSPGEMGVRTVYQACCGKRLCYGCVLASQDKMIKGNMKSWCPFCREPLFSSNKEQIKRLKSRMKVNDANAFHSLGDCYKVERVGLQQNLKLSFEMYTRASELGSVHGHVGLSGLYSSGGGVEKDLYKAEYHMKMAAMGGSELARFHLGLIECGRGNTNHANKHFMIGAKSGDDNALKMIGRAYKNGQVTKDEYAKALRSFQSALGEMKSTQRERAVASCVAQRSHHWR